MTLALEVTHQEEPDLQFGPGHQASSPKEGLVSGGPYDLRLGNSHRSEVRLGLIGTAETIRGMRAFLDRMAAGIQAERSNLALFPHFPGFEDAYRSRLAYQESADVELSEADVTRTLALAPRDAFIAAVELWGQAIDDLTKRELRVDVAICCLPKDLVTRCAQVERSLPHSQRKSLREAQKKLDAGWTTLFESPHIGGEPRTIEDAANPHPEDLLRRNFRSALKARAIEARQPIQLATERLWTDHPRSEDAATRAWNLSVALFYKAGGIPWRADLRVDEACFVGVSFHHLRTFQKDIVFSSLAQAFSSDGEGFALRGEAVPYDERRRQPYLTGEKARSLMTTVLDAYRDRTGRDPLRLVVHKTSDFRPEEREGIAEALAPVPNVQLLTLRSGEFRLLRRGTYPPHRGTLCRVGPASFLFTVGYQPQHLTYPGPHVPVPLEVLGAGDEIESVANDLLCLTKMNWNSARSAAALPITLSFARKVGGVLSELPPGVDSHPSFRYYM